MDELMISIYNENTHQGIKFLIQNERAKPEDYYEFGNSWFELPNFHKDRTISFKISTLNRKNKFGIKVLVIDFVCLKNDEQDSINKDIKTYNEILGKMGNLGSQMCKDLTMKDKKDYSLIVRPAEQWMTEMK